MSAWPSSLQQKMDVDGFQYRFGNTAVVSDMDVGPAKVRNRFTDAIDGYDCQHTIDIDDIAIFKTFYKTTLGNGTLKFTFPDPITGVVTEFRFTPGQTPIFRPLGGRIFTLNMSWEFVP